jgi:isochorismate pyruvate lyase
MTSQELKIKSPDQCLNMSDLRAEVDRLDRALVGLLSERQRYIERAAEIKSHRHDIRDDARIAEVLDKVSAEAKKAGLSEDIARAVWRELMERSIALEAERFKARTISASDNS